MKVAANVPLSDAEFLNQRHLYLGVVRGADVARLYQMVGDFERANNWLQVLHTYPNSVHSDANELVNRAKLHHKLGLSRRWPILKAMIRHG